MHSFAVIVPVWHGFGNLKKQRQTGNREMKTAFPHWDHRIAPVFDTARRIRVVETRSGRIVAETEEGIFQDLMVQKVLRLVELGIGTLVCGAISRPMHGLVTAYGIRVIPFVAGDLQEVIETWHRGRLGAGVFAMPGCQGRGRRFRGAHAVYEEVSTMRGRGRGMGPGGGGAQGAGGGGGQGPGGRRPGRMGGPLAAGPSGYCVCPQCGHREPHARGLPCVERTCPNCGTALMRE